MKPVRIELLDRAEIDEDRWNAVVKNSPYFRHYALTYFMDATASRWKGLIGGDYEWVWPVAVKTFPVPQVYQPLLAQQLGPFGAAIVRAEELTAAYKVLLRRFWRVSVKFSDVYSALPWKASQHLNIELDLNDSPALITKNYKRTAVSNIRKAERVGLKVEQNTGDAARLIEMFRADKGKAIGVLDKKFYVHVGAIYEAFAMRQEAETWAVYLNGELLAGVLLLKTGKRLLNFFTASSPQGREFGAMHALFHTIITRYAGEAGVLDFEGSNDPNLAFFYSSFGGSEKVYLHTANTAFRGAN